MTSTEDIIEFCQSLPADETPFIHLSFGAMSYFRLLTTDLVLIKLRQRAGI